MKTRTPRHHARVLNQTRSRATTLLASFFLLALAPLATPNATAKDINYSSGVVTSGSIAPGDNILVSLGASTSTYTYGYTAPDGTAVTGSKTLGTPVVLPAGSTASITTNAAQFASPGGLTIKPAIDGSVWAVLDGGTGVANARQLLVINEPTTAAPASNYIINMNGVMMQNAFGGATSSGGAMVFKGGVANTTPAPTINGDIVFYNNFAGRDAGAVLANVTGSIAFTGNLIFDSNKAGTADGMAFTAGTGAGGAIRWSPSNTAASALDFRGNTVFINNLSSSNAGAVYGTGGSATPKSIIFHGQAIFEGNVAGLTAAGAGGKGFATLSTSAYHGGGLYLYTATTLTFYDSVSFNKNVASGYGGAMYVRDSDVTFGNETGRTYIGNRNFTFTRNVAAASTATVGGGAIHIDQSSGGSLVVTASNSVTNFTGNATGGSGGAVRVGGGGIYLGQGAFVFNGNQAASSGGALALFTMGTLPAGKTNRVEINTSATFSNNVSKLAGGAIYAGQANNNSMYIGTDVAGSSIAFTNNSAGGNGGAIYISDTAGFPTKINFKATNGDITFSGNRQGVTVNGTIDATAALSIFNGTGADTTGYMTTAATSGTANDIYFATTGMTINLDASAGRTLTFDGGFAGSATTTALTVNKTGAGTLLFGRQSATALGANTNNLVTTTTVAAGTLKVSNGALYGSGAGTINVVSGATIAGEGTFMEATTVKGGANIIIGDAASTVAQKLTFGGNLTLGELASSNTLSYDLLGSSGAANTYDQLIVTNTLALTGTQIFDVTGIGTGTYTLVTAGTLAPTAASYLLKSNGANLTIRYTGILSQTGNTITLSSSMQNLAVAWNGSASNLWQDNAGTNWTNTADANEKFFRNGDSVTIAPAATTTITVATVGVKAADVTITTATGQNTTITGGSIVTSTLAADTTLATATGKLTKNGAGTLTFSNSANTYANGIDINSGTIAFTDGNQLGVGAGTAITFLGDATLKTSTNPSGSTTLATDITINSGNTATLDINDNALALAGALTGAGNINKTGANILTISGNATAYTGTTTINTGALNLGTGAQLGGSVVLSASTTLTGNGAATGNVTATNGSIIHPNTTGAATPQTLTLNNLSLDNTTLILSLYSGSTGAYLNSDHINATGATPILTGTNTIDINGSAQNGTYYLGQNLAALYTGYTGTTLVTLNGASQIQGARQGASLAASGNDLLLTYIADISRIMTWTGSTGANWNIADDNWTDGGTIKKFGSGDHVIFDATGAAQNTVNVAGSGQQYVSDMEVNGATNYTFTGQGINADTANLVAGSTLTPTGKLTKTGSGTLTFANAANTFTGGIDISGGAIAFNDTAQLTTSATTGIHFTGAGGALQPNADALTLANTLAIDNGAIATIAMQNYALTLGGTINGAGTLAKTGTGILTFAADASTFTGTTAINQGTLQFTPTAALGGTVNLAATTTLNGSGNINGTVNAASNSTISIGAPAATASSTLAIANLQLANGSLLTTSNTYTNTLGGTATIGAAANDIVTANIAAGSNLIITATTNGAGAINKTGAGTLTLNTEAALGNTGTTTITAGNLALRNIAAPAALAKTFNLAGGWLDLSSGTYDATGATANDWATLTLNYTGTTGGVQGGNDRLTYTTTGTIAYQIGGTTASQQGLFVVINPGAGGVVTMASPLANTYLGYTRIDSGTLNLSDAAQLGATTNTLILNGGNLHITATNGTTGANTRKMELRAAATITVGGAATYTTGSSFETGGAFTLTKDGTGILNLGAPSTRTGITNLQAGTIMVSATNALGAGALNVTGTGGMFIGTSGTVYATSLVFGINNLAVSNAVTLNNNTLAVNTGNNSGTMTGVISGSGGIIKTGAGALTMTAPSTYSGVTLIATGTLRAGAANAFSGNSVFVVNGGATATTTVIPVLDLGGFDQTVSALTNAGIVNLRGANLTLGNGAGTFTNAGSLILSNTAGARPSINGNYAGASSGNAGYPSTVTARIALDPNGHVTAYDQLVVHGNVTGQNTLIFAMSGSSVIPTGTAGSGANGSRTPTLVPDVNRIIADINGQAIIAATGSMAPQAFVAAVYPNRVFDSNGNELVPAIVDGSGKATLGATLSPEVPATIAIDSIAYLVGKTALDSLGDRVTDLRLDNAELNHRMDLWLHGLTTRDKITDTIYNGSTINTQGAQLGIDYADNDENKHFLFGIYGDYLKSDLRQPNDAKTRAEVYGFGLYASYQYSGFSLDGIFRGSTDAYTIAVAGAPEYQLTGNTLAGSLQAGYNIYVGRGWNIEPQLQGTLQRNKINSGTDYAGRTFNINDIDSLTGRAGLLIWRKYQKTPESFALIPHLRASFIRQYRGDTTLNIGRSTITNDLAETAAQFDLGAIMRFNQTVDVSLNLMYYNGQKINSYSANLGVTIRW